MRLLHRVWQVCLFKSQYIFAAISGADTSFSLLTYFVLYESFLSSLLRYFKRSSIENRKLVVSFGLQPILIKIEIYFKHPKSWLQVDYAIFKIAYKLMLKTKYRTVQIS